MTAAHHGYYRLILLLLLLLRGVQALSALSSSSSSSSSADNTNNISSIRRSYQLARQVRIQHGHDAAQPLYQDILQDNPATDLTTSTRLAAASGPVYQRWCSACSFSPSSSWSSSSNDEGWDDDATGAAGAGPDNNSVLSVALAKRFRHCLENAGYTNENVAKCLGIIETSAFTTTAARAPVYVTPAAPGTVVHRYPFSFSDDNANAKCQILTSLFLLGLAVPRKNYVNRHFTKEEYQTWFDVGFVIPCEYDDNLLLSVVSVIPIDLDLDNDDDTSETAKATATKTLYVVTDWHPRVLNLIQIDNDDNNKKPEEVVMYIGPDSLALVQHWFLHKKRKRRKQRQREDDDDGDDDDNDLCLYLDLCTGSGIQALVALATATTASSSAAAHHAVCVDINPRALRFTRFSAAMNGFSSSDLTLVQGDLLQGTGRIFDDSDENGGEFQDLSDLLREIAQQQESRRNSFIMTTTDNGSIYYYDEITANPPFLPVPPPPAKLNPNNDDAKTAAAATVQDAVASRHGLFSAGGSSGEAVLAKVLELGNTLVRTDRGQVAIVSEFFFSDQNDASEIILQRLRQYWDQGATTTTESCCKALLLTNQYPISAELYAERRADTAEEARVWLEHLHKLQIASCSPGLLYIEKRTTSGPSNQELLNQKQEWQHVIVPKSEYGSIWTPSNPVGVAFTQKSSSKFFGWDG